MKKKMDPEYNLELIEKEIDDLNSEGLPVIVEGEKDERALRAVGFKGEVIRVNRGVSIFNLCEEISKRYSKVILLLDWDTKGAELCEELQRALKANGVSYDTEHRRKLERLTGEIRDVESIDTYIKKLREESLTRP
jgi:5S rRNA maturation endonuclease (ribonuclease M5)